MGAAAATTSRSLSRVTRAADKAASALRTRDDAIRDAHDAGEPLRKIAAACGLSFQRVHQIVRT